MILLVHLKNTLAASSIEVDLSNMKPGDNITVKWRGKPVFIRHRTDEEIATDKSAPANVLKDPEEASKRVLEGHEKWLVMVGICTHLGCVPIWGQGDAGGWLCPCHGSHYDALGRIVKGPGAYQFRSSRIYFHLRYKNQNRLSFAMTKSTKPKTTSIKKTQTGKDTTAIKTLHETFL
ncbi:MAG UNVERIFIED_CONTAM: ubiquinol-cytochrome c reductase iron-sulfur subunit [Rickettsiaceae bacterium]